MLNSSAVSGELFPPRAPAARWQAHYSPLEVTMSKLSKFFSAIAALLTFGLANAAPPTLVGGEATPGAVSVTTMTAAATIDKGALTIQLGGIVGTDNKGKVIISSVPDGAIVCLKANGRQSSDWRGGHVLGKILTTPETCSWGHGVVKDGKVAMTVAACPAGRTEAAAVMSGVVQLADGKQGWLPHPAPYRVLNAKRNADATAFAIDCTGNKVSPLAAGQAKAMAGLI